MGSPGAVCLSDVGKFFSREWDTCVATRWEGQCRQYIDQNESLPCRSVILLIWLSYGTPSTIRPNSPCSFSALEGTGMKRSSGRLSFSIRSIKESRTEEGGPMMC